MKKFLTLISALIFVIFFAGCTTANMQRPTTGVSSTSESTLPIPTSMTPETPTPAPPSLSAQPYASPSSAYQINFPQNWNCSENGDYRVDCQSPDEKASVVIRVVTTGKQLTQPEFLNLAQAEINFAHNGQRAFNENDRNIGNGSLTVQSGWMVGDLAWQGEDYFIRDSSAVYHLNFTAMQDDWAEYAGLFEQVKQSLQPNPSAISDAPAYSSTFKYTSPDSLFTIEIPTSWTKFVDSARIQNTQIEQFFSPDQHASIQIAIYRRGAIIEQEYKATKTLEIMRAFYGSGFRVSHDKALQDGRERLDWYVESKQLSGISFFNSWGGSIYIFTVLWDDSYQELYQPVLERVIESFGFP